MNSSSAIHAGLSLLGSIMYRSARGTKHFGYHQLEKEFTEGSEPMQRSVTSVHPKRHERRTDGIGFRMHGRSSISSHKVAPLAPANKSEDLLIDFDVDCSSAPQTATTGTTSQQHASQSNADVLSLFDSSVAEKYGHLPPALGEKQRVPYDPFEVSEDLKAYASQNATPLHANSVTPSQQYDSSSLQHSWSSFDSVSSQDVSELGSPPPATSQDRTASDRMFGSTTVSQAFAAGAAGADAKPASDTDLLVYANISQWSGDNNRGRRVSDYSNRHSYSYSDSSRSSNRRSRYDQNDQLTSHEVFRDLNANSVVPWPIRIGDSVDFVSDAVSQISVGSTTASQSAAAVSPALAASTASWDEKSLSRHMKAARKRMPNTGSVFYDDVDDDRGNAAWTNSSQDWNSDRAPPVPPRDYACGDTARMTQLSDAIYANVGDRNQSSSSSDVGGMRQLAKVHPFVQASSDIYQNYSEFSPRNVDSADYSVYANMQDQSSTYQGGRSSYNEAFEHGEVGQFGVGAGHSAIQRVRRLVPAATVDECQTALVSCFGDVDSAIRHLKVEQLTRLGIAPRERCRTLLEACNWNLESAGSVLLHELSTGSPV